MEESRFDRFSNLVESSSKSMNKLKSTFMETYSLSATHARCLTALLKHDSLTQAQIAEIIGVDRSQISRVLKELIEKGYVRSDNKSIYKNSYFLSEEGIPVARRLDETILKINNHVSGHIPEDRIEIFYEVLEEISGGLKEATRYYATPELMLIQD